MDHAIVRPRRRSAVSSGAGRPGYHVAGRVGYLWLEGEPAPTPVRIKWLSPVGATLVSDFRDDFTLGERLRVLLTVGDDCPLEGHVIEVRRGDGDGEGACEMRVSFCRIPAETARWVLAYLRRLMELGEAKPPATAELEVSTMTEPHEIRQQLQRLHASGATAWVRTEGPGRPRPARLEPDGALLMRWDPLLSPPGRCIDVEACGYNSVYQFRIEHPMGEFRLPDRIVRRRHRWHRRVAAPSRLKVTFRHPLWPELGIDRVAHDVSFSGLSLETDALDDLLYPGLVLPEVEVTWKGGRTLCFAAIVRHVTDRPDGGGQICGLELLVDPAEPVGRVWCDEVDRLLHPMTGISSGWDEDVWSLYADSGYFGLSGKTPESFEDQRRAFARASDRLRVSPEVGFRIDCVGETRVEASISQVQAWDGSWLVYQLGRHQELRPLSMSGERVLQDLYLHAYEQLQRTPGAQWLISYVQDVARFSRLLHYDLTEEYARSGRASIRQFWAMEGKCGEESTGSFSSEVAKASEEELERLRDLVVEQRGQLYVDGTGLRAHGLDRVTRTWDKVGLRREREVLVARRRGVMVAAAVCEFADDGVHLYGLLDAVRLFAVNPDSREAYPELLAAARVWYRSRGKRRFVYFVDEDDDPNQVPGFTDLGKAYALVLPIDLLPELLERIHTIAARNAGRR